MTSAAADVINHNRHKIQTATILLGKHAYFGLDFCINIVLHTLSLTCTGKMSANVL